MATNWTKIVNRPNDEQRQAAFQTGVGGYGGEDTENEELRQTSLNLGEPA